ncbi:MAG: PAS domain S-box protein [Gemmatimonadales bacterium]
MAGGLLNVLLIRDDDGDDEWLRELLEQSQVDRFALDQVAGFDAGMAALREGRFDVGLVDLGSEGSRLVRQALLEDCRRPLIVIARDPTDDSRLDAFLSGAADVLDLELIDSPLLERSLQHAVERSRYFQEMRRNDERFRALVENVADGIALLDRDAVIRYATPSCTTVTGIPPEELVGRNLFDLIHPDDIATVMRRFSEVLARPAGPVPVEWRLRSPGGTWRHYEGLASGRIEDPAVRAVVVNFRDVSGRKAAERDLLERERQFRALFDAALDAMVIVDDDRKFLDANPTALDLFDLGRTELLSLSLDRFTPGPQNLAAIWPDFVEAGEHKGLLTLVLPGGNRRDVEVSARAHVLPGRHLVVLRDVTERNELENRLRMAAKMEAVGRLAGGIAHDFNNLLTAVLGSCDLLGLQLPAASPLLSDVEEIRRAAQRATRLTQQLLAFSRRQVLHPKILDLNREVEEIQRMLGRLIGEHIEMVTRFRPDLLRIQADPTQLEQILLNLAINARDAMPGGGTLTIETADAAPPAAWNDPPTHCVMLSVRDTGIGMDETVRAHIFEPFFTTKEKGRGTGLGLATVYGIVKQSGGYITVDSAPGQGTTFRIFFPGIDQPAEASEQPLVRTRTRHTGTILLVEDEGAVRQLARRILSGAGYNVLEAASGRDALRHSAQLQGKLDLLVSDVVMPGMSGPELADRLRAEQPGLPVLFISGYPDETLNRAVAGAEADLLNKPFTAEELLDRIRLVLERGEERV